MLTYAALITTLLVALAHLGFMILEAVLWTKPTGMRIFRNTRESAETTKVLALNQGFYNGGVAALLVWAALAGQGPTVIALLVFVIAMGIVGAVTAKGSILFAQALPAAVALALNLLA